MPEPLPWRQARITRTLSENHRMRTLELEIEGWPGHRAGQHLDVRLTAEDGYQAQRSYSIASAPDEPVVRLTVELVTGGEVSAWLVGEAQAGDVFDVRGPIGGPFTWDSGDGGPLLLLGGGSGLVPLMSMLRHRQARRDPVPAHVLVSVRGSRDQLFREELEALTPADGLMAVHTWTRERAASPRTLTGRIDAQMLGGFDFRPGAEPRCFVCGPTGFVERAATLLLDLGHDPRRIVTERFGPS